MIWISSPDAVVPSSFVYGGFSGTPTVRVPGVKVVRPASLGVQFAEGVFDEAVVAHPVSRMAAATTAAAVRRTPVSYTHLTLPTKRIV